MERQVKAEKTRLQLGRCRREVGFGSAEESVPIDHGAKLKVYLRSRTRTALVAATYFINLRVAASQDRKLGTLVSGIALPSEMI